MKKNFLVLVFSLVLFFSLFFCVQKAQASTFYFCSEGDWNSLGNWKTNLDCTEPADAFPTLDDDVIILAGVESNGGSPAKVSTLTVDNGYIFISIEVTNEAIFNNNCINIGTISGNVTFNDDSRNSNSGIVIGDAIFNNTSRNNFGGTVSGNATFNGTSWNTNNGIVSGNAIFYGTSVNDASVVGDAIFYNSSYNQSSGTVGGIATFNDSSYPYYSTLNNAIFNNTSRNNVATISTATFNDSSSNSGSVTTATFNDTSHNAIGNITTAVFNDLSYNGNGTIINATFNGGGYNFGTVTGVAKYTYASGGVITVTNGSKWGYGTAGSNVDSENNPITSWIFEGTGYNHNGIINGDVIFNDTSWNGGTITEDGYASFLDYSINKGTVNGDACFAPTAKDSGTVKGTKTTCSTLTVTTVPASSLTKTSATLNGEITNTGGVDVVERGFEYTLGQLNNDNGTVVKETSGPYGVGTFSIDINSLYCGSYYTFRTYAKDAERTSYGIIVSFATSSCGGGGGGSGNNGGSGEGEESGNLPVPPVTTTTTPANPAPSTSITKILRFGSKGDEVKILQQFLNDKGYNSGLVDGIFGPITRGALIRFQLANKLVGDGIFGPLSRAVYKSLISVIFPNNL